MSSVTSSRDPTESGERGHAVQIPVGSARQLIVPLVVLAGSVTLILWLSAQRMTGPFVFEDELGPFGIARFLAGEGPDPSTKHHPGAALFLVPVFWLTSASSAYQAALFVQCLLAGVVAVVLALTYRELRPTARPSETVLVATAAIAYPSVALSSHLTWSEAASVFWTTLLLLMLLRWTRSGGMTPGAALAWGWLVGLGFVFHPRLVVLIPVSWLVVSVGRFPNRARILAYLGTAAGFGVAALVTARLTNPLAGAGYSNESRMSDLADGRLALSGVLLAGHTLYLLAAIGGLLTVIILRLRTRRPEDTRHRLAATYCLAGIAGLAVLSSVWFSGVTNFLRADHVFYGRYTELFAPAVIVTGIATVASSPPIRGRAKRLFAVPAAFTVGAVALVAGFFSVDQLSAGAGFTSVPFLALFLDGYLSPVVIGALALANLLLWLGVTSLPKEKQVVYGAAVSAALFAATAFAAVDQWAVPLSGAATSESTLSTSIETLADGRCVAVIDWGLARWYRANYEYRSGQPVRVLTEQEALECGGLVVAPPDWEPPMADLTLVGREPTGVSLWEITVPPGATP